MEHIVNIAFDFDDETVKRKIEESAERQVIDKITTEIQKVICGRKYYADSVIDPKDLSPLRNMVHAEVERMVSTYKDEIIEMAADKLCESLKRTKQVKEYVAKRLEE